MSHFMPSHPAAAASYGAYTFSGPEDAYDPEYEEEQRQLEAYQDHVSLMKILAAAAGIGVGSVVGTLYSARSGMDLAQSVGAFAAMGGAVGDFGTHQYYKVRGATEGILSYQEYGA